MRPPSIFYAQQKPRTFDARHRGVVAIARNHQDWFGFAPICFIPACRRAGRCCGDAQKGRFYLPPCVGHYHEEARYLSLSPGGVRDQHQAVEAELAAEGRPPRQPLRPEDWAPPAGQWRWWSVTVLEALYGTSPAALARLRRPPTVRGPGPWERDPDAFGRYMAEGDWRNPAGVCRREPVLIGGRWVE